MSISIKNKVALVTGANRGIGKAIVETFLNQGAKKVYLVVRNTETTKDLEEQYGNRVVTLQADMSKTSSIEELAKQAQDVEIVVNNAGIGNPHSILGKSVEDDFRNQLEVNAFGLLRIANAFTQILAKSKGALVQLNSVASLKNFPSLATYSASKAAAYSLTQALNIELGNLGVHVLSVHPGPIDTDMAAGAGFTETFPTAVVAEGIVSALANRDFHLFPDEVAKQFEAGYQSFSDHFITAG